MGNYFPRDLKKQKAWEFLDLKQGNMTVEEYAAKFQELMMYWPYYQHEDGEEDLCSQFDTRGSGPMSQDKRTPKFFKGPYSSSSHSKSKETLSQERSNSSGFGSGSFRGAIRCFRCGGPDPQTNYGNYGKLGHTANVCWAAPKTSGSVSTSHRPESRGSMGPKPSISGKVFAMSGAEASQS
ncbi:uncharacterized protein LOC113851849 [Abrus precatorius]|uniref:Uncharacterized protein LOC113851849 n=1 Tax=Abrus precatorius TaxID=3816 RepID=A0A8B8K2X4_ABRPR|nr:uncharacterized protein LOC113851849 [Abrus precatorius]